MKTYTLTSHVANQVASLEAASVRRRRVLRPLIGIIALLTVVAMGVFFVQGRTTALAASAGAGSIILLVLGVAIVAGPNERDVAIKRSGAAGEEVLPQMLRDLPDSYTLLNGVPVPGSRADIDHVLVGPSGIWAIEAKNHVGMVQCVGDAWGYTRMGRGGIPIEGHIGNPSQQAFRAADALERYLQRRNVAQRIQPVVVFTHPKVELTVERPSVPILRADQAEQFFVQPPARISTAEATAIVATLRKLRPWR